VLAAATTLPSRFFTEMEAFCARPASSADRSPANSTSSPTAVAVTVTGVAFIGNDASGSKLRATRLFDRLISQTPGWGRETAHLGGFSKCASKAQTYCASLSGPITVG
jgi:hypothetical protein